MIGRDSKGPAVKRLVEFILPSSTRGLCRSKEKQIFLLALGTISFLCFGSIWFLPGSSSGKGNKVQAVRDVIVQQAENVGNLIRPPPPGDVGGDQNNINPNIRHGVLDKPDHHKEEEKAVLDAQIELDEEIKKIRKNQEHQVLAKPNNFDANGPGEKKSSSSLPQALDNEFAKPGKKPAENIGDSGDSPLIQGGEDDDEVARQRRDHVKGVSHPVERVQGLRCVGEWSTLLNHTGHSTDKTHSYQLFKFSLIGL